MTSPLSPTYADQADSLAALADEFDEAPPRRQPGRLVELFVEGEDPYRVRIANRETIAYEKTAAKHPEWPSLAAGQHFAMTFMVWVAAKRAGRTALTFEQWQDALVDWDIVTDVPADPTR
jgi:hypothetical protein